MTIKTTMKKSRHYNTLWVVLVLLAFCFGSCKDDDSKGEAAPYNPSQPVAVTKFSPKTGGIGQRLVIYGQNFGNDPKLVHVTIGGKPAKVIGAEGESLYVIVPPKAYAGDIKVQIGESNIATPDSIFKYQRKMVVSTAIGYKNDRGDEPWKDGKFKDPDQNKMASGFSDASWLAFDPKDSKHLWMVYDNDGGGLYNINFVDSTVVRQRGDFKRPRSIDFTNDGNYMIVAEDRGDNDDGVVRLSRSTNFQDLGKVTHFKQCNIAAVHPVNGELYFNSYNLGEFFRFDLAKYFANGGNEIALKDSRWDQYGKQLFTILDPGWEYRILIHPSGNYAYIMVVNQSYILRTDYNWITKEFTPPYIFSGVARAHGYVDGVGTSSRMNHPYQGVFVKNPNYVADGRLDLYDFYFTDRDNHCIRKLTAEGVLTTFAGRGSSSLNAEAKGYVDGDLRLEARFNDPTGIAYNEVEKAFYVGDRVNHRIRKIALEDIE